MSFKTLSEQIVGQCNKILGDDVTYIPSIGDPISIKAVFDNAWVDIEGVATLKPILRINLSDLSDPPGKGDQAEIEEIEYRVMESRPDGFGGSTLILQKV